MCQASRKYTHTHTEIEIELTLNALIFFVFVRITQLNDWDNANEQHSNIETKEMNAYEWGKAAVRHQTNIYRTTACYVL